MTTQAAPDDRPARQRGLRGVALGWIGLVVCMVMGSALILSTPAAASATRPLIVSLTFDDGSADQMTAQQLLKKHGMVGTFYINSSFIGAAGIHDSSRPRDAQGERPRNRRALGQPPEPDLAVGG